MFRLRFLIVALSIGVTACASKQYSQPLDLRFQESKHENTQTINVKRSSELCAEDTAEKQNCPIKFYIDNIHSGSFYINNSTNYSLKPDVYNFKVKNCIADSCQTCDVDLSVNNLASPNFILSVDNAGKPFISNNGQSLVCEDLSKHEEFIAPPVEKTVTVDLSADTLFQFNGSSLNDLLPEGRQKILKVASQISSDFVSVRQIKLVGYTDRLGTEIYNKNLGQNRADTVRNLLVQKGVSENIISTSSMGKYKPITDGCFNIKQREELEACLQPDRRVTVEITGISK